MRQLRKHFASLDPITNFPASVWQSGSAHRKIDTKKIAIDITNISECRPYSGLCLTIYLI